jgi:hypothetical protein
MARLFVTDINLNKNELQNARIQGVTPAPSAPVTGQIYYDTSTKTMYYYNGVTDTDLQPQGPWVAMGASQEVIQDVIGESVSGGVGLTAAYVDSTGITTIDLDNTAVTAGSYGSQTEIPTFTVDAQGRLTAASTVTVATQLDLGADNAHGGYKLDLLTDSIKFVGGEGIDTDYEVVGDLHNITISGEDATTTNKGIASFADADFTVTTGAVTIKNVNLGTQTTGDYVRDIQGTANEITVVPTSGEGAQVTIGLPDDVTITNNLNVGGNLNVTGTVNSVNTTQVNIVDNVINLNTDFTGDPTVDAGLRVERGNAADVQLRWAETPDQWEITNDGTNYHAITRKFTAVIGDGTTFQYPVTHNLGSSDVLVQVSEVASPYSKVETDVELTSDSVVTIKFATAPSSGAYKVIVVG